MLDQVNKAPGKEQASAGNDTEVIHIDDDLSGSASDATGNNSTPSINEINLDNINVTEYYSFKLDTTILRPRPMIGLTSKSEDESDKEDEDSDNDSQASGKSKED